jgi:hypothetical protein
MGGSGPSERQKGRLGGLPTGAACVLLRRRVRTLLRARLLHLCTALSGCFGKAWPAGDGATGCGEGGSEGGCRFQLCTVVRPDKNEASRDGRLPPLQPSAPLNHLCPLPSAKCEHAANVVRLRKAGVYGRSLEPAVCLNFLVNHRPPCDNYNLLLKRTTASCWGPPRCSVVGER